VTVSPSIADRFQRINSRTIVIYNYPYPEELIGEVALPWERRRLGVSYIGTITAERGIAEMVSAMGMLRTSVPATLEIAGDNIPGEVMKLPGWSRVKFHGVLHQADAYRLLRETRVGIVCEHPIPSFLESVPVKVFEYMGAGIPVIASNFPLWRKMLDKAGCTIFVDPANVREIADAIEYLLTHPLEAEEMGRRGQAAVIDQFNWNTQAGKLVSLYQDLVSPTCAA
jgi:glycosyltransferase involved in cell wall biosynthesis